MSEPVDPFTLAEEQRLRTIVREELAMALRRALKTIAYDNLDRIFGVEPPLSRQRRTDATSRRSPGGAHAVFNEQTVPAPLADDEAEHKD